MVKNVRSIRGVCENGIYIKKKDEANEFVRILDKG